jgi:hypothetical protein
MSTAKGERPLATSEPKMLRNGLIRLVPNERIP